MPLTADNLTILRQWVGSEPDDTALNTLYDLYKDHDLVVMHVLNQRLADLSLEPGSVTVPGLSVSHSSDLQALNDLIRKFQNNGGTGLETSSSFGLSTARLYRSTSR